MSAKSPYGPKVKAVRIRLGQTVNAFAAFHGVSRATQLNYEAGITVPTIDYLDRCLTMGIAASEMLIQTDPQTDTYRNLDFLLQTCPVELHEIVERHKEVLRAGGATAPLYQELWTLFRRGFAAGTADVGASPRGG